MGFPFSNEPALALRGEASIGLFVNLLRADEFDIADADLDCGSEDVGDSVDGLRLLTGIRDAESFLMPSRLAEAGGVGYPACISFRLGRLGAAYASIALRLRRWLSVWCGGAFAEPG